MYRCNVLFYHPDEFSGFFRCDSAWLVIGSVDTKFEQEIRANRFTDCFADLNWEFCTVFQRSTVLIGTCIH